MTDGTSGRFEFDKRSSGCRRHREVCVHRVLNPERAVLIKRGDAFLVRHKLRAAGFRGRFDKIHNGLFGPAIVL